MKEVRSSHENKTHYVFRKFISWFIFLGNYLLEAEAEGVNGVRGEFVKDGCWLAMVLTKLGFTIGEFIVAAAAVAACAAWAIIAGFIHGCIDDPNAGFGPERGLPFMNAWCSFFIISWGLICGIPWLSLPGCNLNMKKIIHTLRPRSLWQVASVCYKTALNTGGVSGAKTDPQTWKMRISFLMFLALRIPILNNFQ